MPDPDGKLRVVIVEDESLYRDALRIALVQTGGLEVVGAYAEAQAALAEVPGLRPQAAVLDIALPGGINGVLLGRMLRRELPDLGIVLLSHYFDPAVLFGIPEAEIAGWSYLLKTSVRDVTALQRAVEGTAAGHVVLGPDLVRKVTPRPGSAMTALAPRQQEALALIAQGYSNAAIARELGVSQKTIENQINVIFRSLGVDPDDKDVQPRVSAVLAYLRATRQEPAPIEGPAPAGGPDRW